MTRRQRAPTAAPPAPGPRPRRGSLLFLLGLAASLAVAAWCGRVYLRPYMVYGHSAGLDYVRQYCFDLCVRDGVFYPRWISECHLGFGAPVFNYYAPLFHLYAQVFRSLGMSLLAALQLARFLLFLIAGAGMYLFARRYTGLLGGVLASALFVLSNYFLANAYVRSASGELLVLAVSPYLLWSLVSLLASPSGPKLVLAAVCLAAVTVSHNISAVLWTATVVGLSVWTAAAHRDLRRLRWGMGAVALALGLSAFFWLPAFLERDLVRVSMLTREYFDYRAHFVFPDQLWEDRWGFGASEEGRADTMPVSPGRALLGAWLVGVVGLAAGRRAKPARAGELWFFVIGSLASLLLALSPSAPLWRLLPFTDYFQFPWRFYVVFTPLAVAAFAAGFGLLQARSAAAAVGIAILLAGGLLGWHAPRAEGHRFMLTRDMEPVLVDRSNQAPGPDLVDPPQVLDREWILTGSNSWSAPLEYLPIWVRRYPPGPPPYLCEVAGSARVAVVSLKRDRFRFSVDADAPDSLVVNQFYFPGWKAVRGGRNREIGPQPVTGRVLVPLDPGRYELDVHFGTDANRRLGWALSALSAMVAIACWRPRLRSGRRSRAP